jgi:peptidoglycan/xylan/chitin deacetylase (PgdA/CDA1 family)
MTWGWNWDGEDEHPAVPTPARKPPDSPRLAGRVLVRRRRLAAAVALTLVLAAILTALAGSHNQRSPTSSRRQTDPRRAAADGATSPHATDGDPVADVLAYTPFVKHGGAHGRDVALTFDDGPGPYTPGVLSVLERYDVQATFFAIGAMEQYFSSSTVRELRDGDVVGDHTETHPEMALLSAHAQREELFEQIARIELLGGARPQLFRPPYGSFNATTMRELHSLHLLMVLWSVDTGDYQQPGVAVIAQRALAGAHPGAIILLHDAGGDRSQTIAALPSIIEGLKARGFHLVTVPALLAEDPPPAGEPLPPNLSGD